MGMVDHVVHKIWDSFCDHTRLKIFLLLRYRHIDELRKELAVIHSIDRISIQSLKMTIEALRTDQMHQASAARIIQASWRRLSLTFVERISFKLVQSAARARLQKP